MVADDNTQLMDRIRPFQIEDLGLRGRLVRLGPAVTGVLQGHDYPEPVARLMAETLALMAVLASALKYNGVFSLQAHGDGPISMVVADMTSDGAVRGYARYDAERVAALGDVSQAPVPKLLGAGRLAFIVDQGDDTERYQGIIELEGATLTDCAHAYFRQSEQLETAISLAADVSTPGAEGAAALMIQRLPGEGSPGGNVDDAEEGWRKAVILMSSVTRVEMLAGDLAIRDVLFRLFHEDGVRLYDPKPVCFQCRCSQPRVESTLKSFPKDEVQSLKDDEGQVSVTCEFCKTVYRFDDEQLEKLYAG